MYSVKASMRYPVSLTVENGVATASTRAARIQLNNDSARDEEQARGATDRGSEIQGCIR